MTDCIAESSCRGCSNGLLIEMNLESLASLTTDKGEVDYVRCRNCQRIYRMTRIEDVR